MGYQRIPSLPSVVNIVYSKTNKTIKSWCLAQMSKKLKIDWAVKEHTGKKLLTDLPLNQMSSLLS